MILSDIQPALSTLVAKLASLGACKIILYGSRARGDNAPRSDIDLAVEMPENSTLKAWGSMLEAAENADTLLKIDLVNLMQADDKLKANILRDGKILYERPA